MSGSPMAAPDPSHPDRASLDALEQGLPAEWTAELRGLANPPVALPTLVDARIRAAIDEHFSGVARVERRFPRRIAAGWCAAAIVALAAGAALGSRPVATTPPSGPAREALVADASPRFTVIDAFAAARAVRDGVGLSPALATRLDVDRNGRVDEADVARLMRLAVGVRAEGSTPS
ncbi:MAG: hypothetical protein KDA22_11490 [Phycisphaerales bacterium]|nr:hypothetical protein [Phycisphaerales bacterium]